MIAPICLAPTSASWSAITERGIRSAASRTSPTSLASSIARRTTRGVRASAASRSTSVTTPIGSPLSEMTGRWRTPLSIMASISSLPSSSRPTVKAGALIAALIGASVGMPSATTRTRRSWSVRIPSPVEGRVTSAQLARASAMRRAASRIEISDAQRTSCSWMSAWAGRSGRTIAPLASEATPGRGRAMSDRARKRSPVGRARRGRTSSAASR
jgi:hypothetical protein